MGKIASWGPMTFQTSPAQVVMFEGLSTSVSLKSDTQSDTSGTSQTNTRGLELQPMTFTVTYMRSLGTNPRVKIDEWTALVGKYHPLYIGGKRFGPAKMTLKKVEPSDFMLSTNNGDILKVTVKITLEEYSTKTTVTSGTSTKKTSSGGSSSGSSTSSQQKAKTKYDETVEKLKAMKATASKEDKSMRKPGAGVNKREAVLLN